MCVCVCVLWLFLCSVSLLVLSDFLSNLLYSVTINVIVHVYSGLNNQNTFFWSSGINIRGFSIVIVFEVECTL